MEAPPFFSKPPIQSNPQSILSIFDFFPFYFRFHPRWYGGAFVFFSTSAFVAFKAFKACFAPVHVVVVVVVVVIFVSFPSSR